LRSFLLRSSAVALVILGFLVACPLATTSTAEAAGLGVVGSLVDITVEKAPATHVHTMTISNGFKYPLDIEVEARGLGQEPDGSYVPLSSAEDQSPFTALSYITEIDRTAFHLDSGADEEVKATIRCPADATPGTRYACIYIHSAASGEGPVGVSVAAIVPVVVTVPDPAKVIAGDITGLTVKELESRQPIEILTTFKNMGTYHYKAENHVTIEDSAGEVFSDETTDLTSVSIIPPFSRLFAVSCVPADRDRGLPPGDYTVVSKVVLEGGTVLDVETTGLTVPEWYKPPSPETKKPRVIDWVLVVIGILAALVVLIIIMYLILRRVRKIGRPLDSGY
jgi:hypothetical protein